MTKTCISWTNPATNLGGNMVPCILFTEASCGPYLFSCVAWHDPLVAQYLTMYLIPLGYWSFTPPWNTQKSKPTLEVARFPRCCCQSLIQVLTLFTEVIPAQGKLIQDSFQLTVPPPPPPPPPPKNQLESSFCPCYWCGRPFNTPGGEGCRITIRQQLLHKGHVQLLNFYF